MRLGAKPSMAVVKGDVKSHHVLFDADDQDDDSDI
jgi:hypothetical protein